MKIEKVPKEMKSEKNFFEVKDGNSECVLSINEDAKEIIIWSEADVISEETYNKERIKGVKRDNWVVVIPEVIIREKSSFQKDDCLFCDNKAVHEAVFGNAHIRCCNNDKCIISAEKEARRHGYRYKQEIFMSPEGSFFLDKLELLI